MNKNEKGFTLLELVVSSAIYSVVSMTAIFCYTNVASTIIANVEEAKQEIVLTEIN